MPRSTVTYGNWFWKRPAGCRMPAAGPILATSKKNAALAEETMCSRALLTAVSLAAAILVSGAALAQTPATALTGLVSSAEDGAMEGVLVSASKTGSPVTVTVVTGKHGRFSF